MSIRTLLAATFAGLLAVVLLAAPASAHDHDHADGTLTLEYLGTDTDATDTDVVAKDHGQHGPTYPPDIDGYVPTSYGGDCYDNVLAYASWYSEGDWYIVYDKCEMERYGAGQSDWDRVGAHEKAHTDGWGHYEEPRDRNAAFEPGIVICRC